MERDRLLMADQFVVEERIRKELKKVIHHNLCVCVCMCVVLDVVSGEMEEWMTSRSAKNQRTTSPHEP